MFSGFLFLMATSALCVQRSHLLSRRTSQSIKSRISCHLILGLQKTCIHRFGVHTSRRHHIRNILDFNLSGRNCRSAQQHQLPYARNGRTGRKVGFPLTSNLSSQILHCAYLYSRLFRIGSGGGSNRRTGLDLHGHSWFDDWGCRRYNRTIAVYCGHFFVLFTG